MATISFATGDFRIQEAPHNATCDMQRNASVRAEKDGSGVPIRCSSNESCASNSTCSTFNGWSMEEPSSSDNEEDALKKPFISLEKIANTPCEDVDANIVDRHWCESPQASRSSFKQGDDVEVYSPKRECWFQGTVQNIEASDVDVQFIDIEGKPFTVRVPLDSEGLRPHANSFAAELASAWIAAYDDNDADGEQSPNAPVPLERLAFDACAPSSPCSIQLGSWHQEDFVSQLVWSHLVAVSEPSHGTSQPWPEQKPMHTNLRRARRISASDLQKQMSRC